jgi:limonene-1,2-epoxide hydrolase
MTKPQHDIEQFFQRWGTSFHELCAAFRESFAEDGEWIAGPPPIPVTHGGNEAAALLEGFKQSYDLTTIDVEILHLGQSGNVVYSERIDHLIDSKGSRFISLPVAGVMALDDDGRITHWRDYWDMLEFLELPTVWGRARRQTPGQPKSSRA